MHEILVSCTTKRSEHFFCVHMAPFFFSTSVIYKELTFNPTISPLTTNN